MAGSNKYDVDQLIDAFREFSTDSKCMNNQECGKLVKNALGVKMSNEGDIAFSKVKTQGKKTMDLDGKTVGKFIELMAQDYERKKQPNPDKIDTQTLLANKIIGKKATAKAAAAKTSKTGGVDRLTDASKYTGSHKERFDESGKGKGKDGRVDEAKNDGYVGAYKGSGSYDKK